MNNNDEPLDNHFRNAGSPVREEPLSDGWVVVAEYEPMERRTYGRLFFGFDPLHPTESGAKQHAEDVTGIVNGVDSETLWPDGIIPSYHVEKYDPDAPHQRTLGDEDVFGLVNLL